MKKQLIALLLLISFFPTLWAQDDDATLSASQLREKGVNAQRIGLTELAERYYRQALATPEGDPSGQTQQLLGILCEEKEYFDEAIVLLDQSNTSEALAHQAFCLLQLGMPDSASHVAARAIELDTGSALAMTMMAYVET
ncbi:MAG: hypothetical protein II531_04600, partial [Bacteroidales bacterium]|nr:hypothetical protein [Bacteroidales bacterium]